MSQIVSIRMPKKMVIDLKKTSKNNYYLDLSEYLRSIIRKKSLEYARPYETEITKIRAGLEKNKENKRKRAKKEILNEIQKYLEGDL